MADDKAPENIEEPLDFGKKKKKKKDKAELLKEVEAAIAPAANADDAAKKLQDLKLTETGTTSAAPTPTPGSAATTAATTTTTTAGGDEELDFTKLKKPKKGKVTFDESGEVEFASQAGKIDQQALNAKDSQGSWHNSERDYEYEELLKRVFDIMEEKNPGAVTGEKKKFIMKPPQVARVGTKKTSFTNFGDICRLLKRQEKHLLNFLLAELGTTGSLDINNQLIIKGRFQQKQIETVLRRYIKEYVTCHTCRSPDTNLVKEERIFFLQCDQCGSRCAVASIKSGFQAQVLKRAAQRAKAT